MKKAIDVSSLPKGGPYSHANLAGDFVFVSGQTGQVSGKDTTFTQRTLQRELFWLEDFERNICRKDHSWS